MARLGLRLPLCFQHPFCHWQFESCWLRLSFSNSLTLELSKLPHLGASGSNAQEPGWASGSKAQAPGWKFKDCTHGCGFLPNIQFGIVMHRILPHSFASLWRFHVHRTMCVSMTRKNACRSASSPTRQGLPSPPWNLLRFRNQQSILNIWGGLAQITINPGKSFLNQVHSCSMIQYDSMVYLILPLLQPVGKTLADELNLML